MRKLILILLLIPLISSAQDLGGYYVADSLTVYSGMNTSSDLNDGSYLNPWATWDYGVSQIIAGDTLYIRGGVYYVPSADRIGMANTFAGTISDTIKVWNYPGETPILDGQNITNPSGNVYGVVTAGTYLHIKGLTVRNFRDHMVGETYRPARGWQSALSNSIIENCVVYNVGGEGFASVNGENQVYYINCDAYHCADSLNPINPGNDGCGFEVFGGEYYDDSVFYWGCRAWYNGDDGFQSISLSYTEWKDCYAYLNGQLGGLGHGFKIGYLSSGLETTVDSTITLRAGFNNVALYNISSGFTTNENDRQSRGIEFYNNVAYGNGTGFVVYKSINTCEVEEYRIFKNNVSYNNTSNIFLGTGACYTHTNNTWDVGAPTVTDADFVSVDTTGMLADRQADGSLPDNNFYNNFMRLATGSQLIDAGTDVGLSYEGTAPDLGAFESNYATPVSGSRKRPAGSGNELYGGGDVIYQF